MHGQNIKLHRFAIEIFKLNSINQKITPIPTSEYPTPAPRPLNSVMNLSKIEADFDIKPKNWKESFVIFVQTLIK